MIGWLQGNIIHKSIGQVILDTGGVGYDISVPLPVGEALHRGEKAALFIHHAQREDGQYLYGFADIEQRTLFRELTKVSGVGPKMALMILSGLSVNDFVRVVHEQNVAALVKVPGIGKKTAERLLVDLGDRLGKSFQFDAPEAPKAASLAMAEAETALVNLGCKPAEAQKVMEKVLKNYAGDPNDAEALIRAALQHYFEGMR
ncbi:MAG: Holliday junction branch migration protein RuvA [Cardiobacteriaceae bacterium]|nr:Holliday junction branch migration protein RuvA [Cardiobacteriaceae bacterium]